MLRNIFLGAAASLCCLEMAHASGRFDAVYNRSINRTLYEARAFLPFLQKNDTLLFSDIRTVNNFGDNSSYEVNLGLGFRKHAKNIDTVLGAYYFYDRRHENDIFQQNTLGAELLHKKFEARANVYLPFENASSTGNTSNGVTLEIQNNIPMISYSLNQAYKGFDTELGIKIPFMAKQEFWLYGGFYKFDTDEEGWQGAKLRVEFSQELPYNLLSNIGFEYDYNEVVDRRDARLSFRLGVPIGGKMQGDSRLSKSIVRDVDIKVEAGGAGAEPATIKAAALPEEYQEISLVQTTEELEAVLAETPGDGNKRLIVITDDVIAFNDVTIGDNQLITGGDLELEFAGTKSDIKLEQAMGEKAVILGHLGEITNPEKIVGVTEGEASTTYDNQEYQELALVKTETELLAAIAATPAAGNKKIIALTDEVITLREITIGNDEILMGGDQPLEFSIEGTDIKVNKSFTNKPVLLAHVGDITNPEQVKQLTTETAKVIYDDKEYDKVYFVTSGTELKNASTQLASQFISGRGLVILDSDISISDRTNVNSSVDIIGKGTLTVQADSGKTVLAQLETRRKITTQDGGNIAFLNTNNGAPDIIFGGLYGVEHNAGIPFGWLRFDVHHTSRDIIANYRYRDDDTYNHAFIHDISGDLQESKHLLEDIILNVDSTRASSLFEVRFDAPDQYVRMSNVEINHLDEHDHRLFRGANIEVLDKLTIRDDGDMRWTATTAHEYDRLTLKKDAEVILESLDGAPIAKYRAVNGDASLATQQLEDKLIKSTDLSTLHNNIIKVQ